MSKEERRRRRKKRLEEDAHVALGCLRFVQSQGVVPLVTSDGKFTPFVDEDAAAKAVPEWGEWVKEVTKLLHGMYRSEWERSVLVAAWERLQDEE